MLLEHGARVDDANLWGWTALMVAAKNDHGDVVKILLHHGAKREVKSFDGRENAEEVAERMGHHDVAVLLKAP